MFERKAFLQSGAALIAGALLPVAARAAAVQTSLRELERESGGRLGVFAVDTGSGRTVEHRSHERFAMCSTFKLCAVAAVLQRVDRGEERLERPVSYTERDLLEYAPVTRAHVREGQMRVRDLCAAAIEFSDNTAANLLVASVGGPAAVTRSIRSFGDPQTRLDRIEPALNTAIPGDVRDTTTPAAIARDMQRFVTGDTLKPASRELLKEWLLKSQTGATTLRAGLPQHWVAGDKTGTGGAHNAYGDSDTRNDVAIAWPPHRKPIVMAVYLTGCKLRAAQRDAILARTAKAIAAELSGP
ncbi:MAG TPA: class A beta-lactamase [Candidatus Baltobacteraceae bacterium]|nr:class A beta-lactamase [Candidatus Baltobacteraceae bacterium]